MFSNVLDRPWMPPDMQPTPPLKPDACNLTTPDGDIPNLKECSKYFTCTNGLSISRSCPAGLYFNNMTKNCDFPRNIATGPCKGTDTVTRSTTTTPASTRSTESTRSTRSTPSTKPTRPAMKKTKPTDNRKKSTSRQTTHKRLMST